MERPRYRRHDTDFFFPILLITIGAVWLLVNSGIIAIENVYRLAPFWPVLLIAAGLSLLVRRLWWPLGALIWLLLAGVVLWALIAAPGLLPANRTAEFRQVSLSEPVGQAQSAEVVLDLSINSTRIHPLSGGDDLIQADLHVANDVSLDVSGTSSKTVRLRQEPFVGFRFPDFTWIGQNIQPWDIGLTTEIPLDLVVDASTGSTTMDLTGIELTGLDIDGSTGSMQVTLPAGQESFPFDLDMSTGSMNIQVPEGTSFEMTADGSTASVTIDVPDGAGLRVEVVSGGPGSLNLPNGVEKISGERGDDEGVYQNDAYETSENPIDIQVDLSTGSFTVR